MSNKRNFIAIGSLGAKLLVAIIFILLSNHRVNAQGQDYDALMREYGMVDIEDLDQDILVELKYSTKDNFVGLDMYGDLESAYLEREFANRVALAQKILKRRYPNLTLLIYDAARPISTQRTMYKCVEGTELEHFVASGKRGGRHNYGVAVDLTIASIDGTPLDMGAAFDDFTSAAYVKGTADTSDPTSRTIDVYRRYVEEQVSKGIISRSAANNRILLLEVMCEAGLYPYRREWWHYEDIMPIDSVRVNYRLLDF